MTRISGLLCLLFFCQSVAGQQESASGDATQPAAPRADAYSRALQPWFGDYEGMVERRMVRIAVPYSMTHYFLDGASERGVSVAMGRRLETAINRRENLRTRLVDVVFIPAPRKLLLQYVSDGLADLAMGGLVDTSMVRPDIAPSIPFIRNSDVVLVTGPGGSAAESADDLAGKTIYVVPASEYIEPLRAVSRSLEQRGMAPIDIATLEPQLEPDEVLELVQAGLLPATIMDGYLVDFWSRVFPQLTAYPDIVLGQPHNIAWAIRINSPDLEKVVNEFLRSHRQRTEFGNVVLRRYLDTVRFVNNPTASRDWRRFEAVYPHFQKYGETYEHDPLLLAALGYQESRLDQNTRSPVGAIGVMQLLPQTGALLNVGDITELEPNIHAGAKYLRSLMGRRALGDGLDPLNHMFFALASYNAGQTRIRRLRRQAVAQGLNPDIWHDNVELLAAREIGRETVQYVDNIYKYYLAYRRVQTQREQRDERSGNRDRKAENDNE